MLYEGVNVGEKDFAALVAKIKQAGAEIVYWGGLHTEGGLIARQMRDGGLKAVMMSGDGITDDEFAAIGGPAVEGTLMTFPPDPRKRPEAAAVVEGVRSQEVRPAGLHALHLRGARNRRPGRRRGQDDRRQEASRPRSVGGKAYKTVIGDDRSTTRRATSPVRTTSCTPGRRVRTARSPTSRTEPVDRFRLTEKAAARLPFLRSSLEYQQSQTFRASVLRSISFIHCAALVTPPKV